MGQKLKETCVTLPRSRRQAADRDQSVGAVAKAADQTMAANTASEMKRYLYRSLLENLCIVDAGGRRGHVSAGRGSRAKGA